MNLLPWFYFQLIVCDTTKKKPIKSILKCNLFNKICYFERLCIFILLKLSYTPHVLIEGIVHLVYDIADMIQHLLVLKAVTNNLSESLQCLNK